MGIPRRGIQDIRTLAGKGRTTTIPHEAYLRICHIEMEKARKTQEREKARQLMADIATRLAEIEAEKESLLQTVGERGCKATLGQTGPPRHTGGFKIKY